MKQNAARNCYPLRSTLRLLLPSQPLALLPREAARRLCERNHVVIVADADTMTNSYRLIDTLGRACGVELEFIHIVPSYTLETPRPICRLYTGHVPGRPYPPLLIGFLPDTPEYRALIDKLMLVLAVSAGGVPAGQSVSNSAEGGPIVLIDGQATNSGAAIVLNGLQDLYRGTAEDLSLN